MKLLTLSIGSTRVDLPNQITTVNNETGTFGINILKLATDLFILAAVLLALIFVIFGGWKWLTSEGDKKKLDDAKHTLTFSILGLIVVMLAFFIINVLGAFFNVPILTIQ